MQCSLSALQDIYRCVLSEVFYFSKIMVVLARNYTPKSLAGRNTLLQACNYMSEKTW